LLVAAPTTILDAIFCVVFFALGGAVLLSSLLFKVVLCAFGTLTKFFILREIRTNIVIPLRIIERARAHTHTANEKQKISPSSSSSYYLPLSSFNNHRDDEMSSSLATTKFTSSSSLSWSTTPSSPNNDDDKNITYKSKSTEEKNNDIEPNRPVWKTGSKWHHPVLGTGNV